MAYDYSKLRGKIVEKYGSQYNFAKAMNIGNSTLTQKMTNKAEWSQREMTKALSLLEVDSKEVERYFFSHLV